MGKTLKEKRVAETKYFRRFIGGASIFTLAFLMAFLSSSFFMKPYESNADQIAATVVNSAGYSLALTSAGRLSKQLVVNASGTTSIMEDTLNVVSTAENGYAVLLSMDNNKENGDRLYLDGIYGSSDYIEATSGTVVAPAELDANSWGFAVPGLGGVFDSEYRVNDIVSRGKFAAVPLRGHEVTIATGATTTTNEGDDIPIYYGVKGDTRLSVGMYTGTVIYTALPNSNAADSGVAYISPSLTYKLAGGELMTITTGLRAPVADVGIPEVKIGGEACTNVVVSSNSDDQIVITCNSPRLQSGYYDAAINFGSYNTEYFIGNAVEYKSGLYTKDVQYMLYAIDYMQQMTPEICAELPTPTSTTINTTNDDQELFANTTARGDNTSTLIPQSYLIDRRNKKSYTVRKLADGNCWMAQNLYLAGNTPILPSDSNVEIAWQLPASVSSWSSSATTAIMNEGSHIDNATNSNGSYFNWCAAVAGPANCNSIIQSGASSEVDVCPRNWSLPSSDIYGALYNAYNKNQSNFDKARASTYVGFNISAEKNSIGLWWSSTADGSSNANALREYTTVNYYFYTAYPYSRGNGMPIRCFLKVI